MVIRATVEHLPIADASVDMIFCDPPYIGSLVHTYRWLAVEAARVLRPGGFVAVICGGNKLNYIMRWFDDVGLAFYWLYQLGMTGARTGIVWKYGNQETPISTRTKHVLVYSRGRGLPRCATTGLYWAGGVDKRWHHWGQDIDSHRYYIEAFSAPGDLVLDPMCGGGTTGVACALLGRRCVLADIDAAALDTTMCRLSDGNQELDPLPLFAGIQNRKGGE